MNKPGIRAGVLVAIETQTVNLNRVRITGFFIVGIMTLLELQKIFDNITNNKKLYFKNIDSLKWGEIDKFEITKENLYYDDERRDSLYSESDIKEIYGGEIPDFCELEIPKGSLVIII